MAQGQEYLTSNAAIAYPFREDAPGLARGTVVPVHWAQAIIPLDFIVDLCIDLPATFNRVYLKSILKRFANQIFTFVDEFGVTIISAPLVAVGSITPGYYSYLSMGDLTTGVSVRMVVKTSTYQSYMQMAFNDFFQQRLPLEERAINRLGNRVKSFELYTALPVVPAPNTPGPIVDDVKFISGYNVSQVITVDADGVTSNTIDAVTGAGAGVAPCQNTGSSVVKKQLMQLVPDENGNVMIQMGDDKCYALVPHIGTETFEIQGTCLACCQCDDYANVATALKLLFCKATCVYDCLLAGHHNYELGVTQFNRHIANRFNDAVLVVNGSSGSEWKARDPYVRTGAVHYLTLVITFKNKSAYPIQLKTLDAGITDPSTYFVRQITWEYDGLGGSWGNGDVPGMFPLTIPALTPIVESGKCFVIYVLARVADYTLDDPWTGKAILETEILVPYPDPVGPTGATGATGTGCCVGGTCTRIDYTEPGGTGPTGPTGPTGTLEPRTYTSNDFVIK